ncbi:MAG: thiolase family protein [Chloroflexota bacterium]
MAEILCGGIAGGLAIKYAMSEIMLGRLEVALCYAADKEASIRWFKKFAVGHPSPQFDPVAMQLYGGPGVVWAYAMATRRYMHQTGAREEHFAMATVRDRHNARHNPLAAFTEPLTVAEVMASPVLCSPIKRLDASTSLDGGAAVVVASEDFARRRGLTPVYVTGCGEYHDNSCYIPTDGVDKPIDRFVAVRGAAERAYRDAGITPAEIDVAELYAPFSPFELIIAEEMGFFERGGMIKALENGETGIGGRLPINTDGGLLSRGHPWTATPLYETITIVRQLRGEAGESQVAGARTGLIQCEGGMLNNAMVIIFSRD